MRFTLTNRFINQKFVYKQNSWCDGIIDNEWMAVIQCSNDVFTKKKSRKNVFQTTTGTEG